MRHSTKKRLLFLFGFPFATLAWAQQQTIDFENQPALTLQSIRQAPCGPAAAVTAGSATFTGGTPVSLNSGQNTVYWTAQGCAAWQADLSIHFAQPVSGVTFHLGATGASATFTVQDDQGDSVPVNLGPSGSTPVSLSGRNVQKITIVPSSPSGWSYYLDNVTYTPATPSITLLDPVPQLLVGGSVATDPGLLSIGGAPVSGVAADSAARLVVRINANSIGEQLTLALLNDQGAVSGSAGEDGELTTIDGRQSGGQLQLTAVHTTQGPMAFAMYTPPADFVRQNGLSAILASLPVPFAQPGSGDSQAATRTVTLRLTSLTVKGSTTSTPIVLARPPVVLAHDLWGGPADWNSFSALTTDPAQRFFVARASYNRSLAGRLLASTPTYSGLAGNTNDLGFAANAPTVWEQIEKQVLAFRREKSLAAAQADVVAHGMGGLVARTLEGLPGFAGADSFGAGDIHKLITLGSPHFGTPVALDLLNQPDSNACTRNWLAQTGDISLLSATLDAPANVVTGAIGDLRGDGRGDDLAQYAPLNNVRVPNGHPVSTAVIAAITLPSNLNSLACPGNAAACLVRQFCSSDPLAQAMTPSGWFSVFGQTNDGFAPLMSEWNGFSPLGYVFPGIVHSPGLESLGFTGPSELDESRLVQPAVVQLLNGAVHGIGFMRLP